MAALSRRLQFRRQGRNILKKETIAALFAACSLVSACGGNDTAATPPPPPPPPAAQSFNYYPPALGETETWSRTLTDSVGPPVSMQTPRHVTAANDSGGVEFTYDDPTATDVVEDGIT